MTISYHSGGRLQGTSTDYNSGDGIPAEAGGWKEIGRTTLGSTTSTIDVASLADKRYLMLLTDIRPSGAVDGMMRLNNDSGSNYACRYSNNGGSDGTDTSASLMYNAETPSDTNPMFAVSYISNLSNKEKLHLSHSVAQKTAGAAQEPNRGEYACKWANTSDTVDRITTLTSTGNNYASGSELVVLGWDTDNDNNNFWEQLASVNGDGSGGFSSGTITAKKYLWVQVWCEPSASSYMQLRFNSDSGSNYARRASNNGGSDGTGTSESFIQIGATESTPQFFNFFIINNSANEKLVICDAVTQMSTGAGNAPEFRQTVGKWDNTSSQITDIEILPSTGNLSTSSIMKVWGSN